jgi:mRNA interferase HigB
MDWGMHVISRKPFRDAGRAYPNDADAIERTCKVLRNGEFSTPQALRRFFPSLDNFRYRDKWWVLDIGGNNLRLIAFIDFRDQKVFVKHIVNHPEYDRLCQRYRKRSE